MSQTCVSILALTESCISKFDSLLASYARDSQRVEPLETRLADFKFWADGVGALAKPGASLDSRLQSRVNDLTSVKNALIMLADSLDHWVGLVEDTANHDGTDHHEAIQNIDSAIKTLALIGVATRRTGRASRNRRPYKTFNPDNHQELRTHLECIIRLRPTKEALFHQTENGEYVAKLDNPKLSDIQNRLIEANLRRRRMFLIAQKYSRAPKNVHIRPLIPVAPSPAGNILKEEPFANTKNADEANNQNPTPYSITGGHESTARTISDFSLASTAEGTLQYTPATRKYTPSITKTQITFIASDVEFPKAPSIHSGREIVKCPCCCQSLPIETLQNPKSWKQHIVEDLCPYTCIAENCPTPQLLFCTRNEWESHVKETHLPQWQCPFCEEQNEDYSTVESMSYHLRYAHREELLDNPPETLLSWSAVKKMGIKSCPLCSSCGPEDSPELVDHVLRHAYDFALRALPWPQPTEYDLNILPGGFTLSKDSDHVEDLQRWIKEASHESVGLLEMQLSDYDRADNSVPVSTNLFEYSDYFLENAYFDDQSEDRSSKLQINQSNASAYSTMSAHSDIASRAEYDTREMTQSQAEHDEARFDGDDRKLHDAVRIGKPDAVMLLLSHGANIQARDVLGESALHIAVETGQVDVAELLLLYGADIEALNNSLRTPLLQAVFSGNVEVVKLLISRGANINIRDIDGGTLLHCAAMARQTDMAELLLTYGANIEAKNHYNMTPLYTAVAHKKEEVIKLLLSRGANINFHDRDGDTPLHIAVEIGQVDVAELLLTYGADVEAKNSFNASPLHIAVLHQNKEIAKLLLSQGANVNSRDEDSNTPLHYAARTGQVDVAELLLTYGADVEAKNSFNVSPLHIAVLRQKKEIAKLLLSQGADVNSQDKDGNTPLHYAICSVDEGLVELILDHGADIEAKDTKGRSPLYTAASDRKEEIAKLLLSRGANVNAQDKDGKTPSYYLDSGSET